MKDWATFNTYNLIISLFYVSRYFGHFVHQWAMISLKKSFLYSGVILEGEVGEVISQNCRTSPFFN